MMGARDRDGDVVMEDAEDPDGRLLFGGPRSAEPPQRPPPATLGGGGAAEELRRAVAMAAGPSPALQSVLRAVLGRDHQPLSRNRVATSAGKAAPIAASRATGSGGGCQRPAPVEASSPVPLPPPTGPQAEARHGRRSNSLELRPRGAQTKWRPLTPAGARPPSAVHSEDAAVERAPPRGSLSKGAPPGCAPAPRAEHAGGNVALGGFPNVASAPGHAATAESGPPSMPRRGARSGRARHPARS